MLTEARRRHILEILTGREDCAASVEELRHLLGVSQMTVRRDLDWLAERGLLRRVHGGAVAHQSARPPWQGAPGAPPEWKPFVERRVQHSREKQFIGWAAAQLVSDGERIILDSGTTTLHVARNLDCRQDLVAITHSLPVAEELARCPNVTTIVLGGLLKPREMCNVGPTVTQELARLSVDKLFLSAAGFSLDRGVTDPDMRENEVRQAMIRAAREIILVADSSKWGAVSLVQIIPLDVLDKIITDDGLPRDAVEAITALGVQVITPYQLSADPAAAKLTSVPVLAAGSYGGDKHSIEANQ